jgi:mono/diheme cytochrome c family protein
MNARLGSCGLAAAVVFLGACASARRSEPITGRTLEHRTDLAEGRRVFMQQCHTCHPGGEAGLGPAINNKPLPRSLIKFQVRHGLGVMPAFKAEQLTQAELDAVAEYLVALRRIR